MNDLFLRFSKCFKMPRSNNNLQILLENPERIYYGGERIRGQVLFSNDHEIDIKNIQIRFFGKARVRWVEQQGKTSKTQRSSETYFQDGRILHGQRPGRHKIQLEVANHRFHFSYRLPSGIPSSFYGCHGSVHYFMETLVKTWSTFESDISTTLDFRVERHLDLNTQSMARERGFLNLRSGFGQFFCRPGDLRVKFQTERSGFVPLENINFMARLENSSGMTLKKPEVKLVEMVAYFANNNKRKIKARVLAKIKWNKIRGTGTSATPREYIWNGSLKVPRDLVPTSLGGCGIIDVQYYLQFEQPLPFVFGKLKGTVPIVIGTLPVIYPAENEQSQSSSSETISNLEQDGDSPPDYFCAISMLDSEASGGDSDALPEYEDAMKKLHLDYRSRTR